MKMSVVIPTCDRPELLARSLRALAGQDFAGEWEVIVVDDGSGGGLVVPEGLSLPVEWKLLRTSGHRGPATARNVGWRAARGEIIAFTDDDTIPAPDWLTAGHAAFRRGVLAVAGRVEVPLPPEPTDHELNEAGLATAEFVTANCFVRRAVLEALGGFDEAFRAAWREDSDLHFRLLRRCAETGERLTATTAAVVVHPVRPAPWGVSLRQQRKAMFNALLWKKHPLLYRLRIQNQPPWHYYAAVLGCLACILAAMAGWSTIAWGAGAVWVAATGFFFLRRATRTRRRWGELALTSALIPFLSVFWRLRGAVRFRAWFL